MSQHYKDLLSMNFVKNIHSDQTQQTYQLINPIAKIVQWKKIQILSSSYTISFKFIKFPASSMSETNIICLGQILFSEEIANDGKLELVSDQVIDNLESQTWLIKNGRYSKDHWKSIIPYIKELRIKQLVFYNNPEPNILKEIASINFLQLKWLFLRKNNIQNIQPIVWLSVPKLQKLILSNNEFTTVKPLQKLNCPMLSEIHINGNPFKKAPLDRIKTGLKMDCISFEEMEGERIVACDLSAYSKTYFCMVQLIQVEGIKRIRQNTVRKCLERKFGLIKLSKLDVHPINF